MDLTTCLRNGATTLAGFGLSLSLAACGSGEPDPIPPSESETSSATDPSPTATSDAGGAPAGWEDKFSDRQLRAYEEALGRWERYSDRLRPIYAKGKSTAAARQFFENNALRPQERIRLLDDIERAGIREVEPPEVLWTRAKSVQLSPAGTGTVLITQCVDYTGVRWEQRNGAPAKGLRPETLVTPLTTRMNKPDAKSDWLYADTEVKGKKSCAS